MVSQVLFKDRDGRTELSPDFKKELIPKNVFTSAELDALEEENNLEGESWLADFNGEHLDWMFWLKLNKKLFGNVWKWAGKFRQRELNNEEYNHPGYIAENIKKLEGDLKYWLENNSFKNHQETIARFHEQFLTIHPFANGNGRTARILVQHICKRQGIDAPTWGKSMSNSEKKRRESYIAALVKARRDRDYSDLIRFMWS